MLCNMYVCRGVARVSFSSCQRNLIKTFQIEAMIAMITKMALIYRLPVDPSVPLLTPTRHFGQLPPENMPLVICSTLNVDKYILG